MIKITAGKFNGKKIRTISKYVRPTSSLKRQAFFSVIESFALKYSYDLYNENTFQEGTIKPKIKAALHFLKHHGEKVVITSIDNIETSINRQSGTLIRN